MRLLLTSAGVKNASINDALRCPPGQADCRIQRPCHPDRGVRASVEARRGMAVHQRPGEQNPNVRTGLEDAGVLELTALPSIPAGAVGHPGQGDRRPAGRRWRCPVPEPLDAQSGLAELLPSLRDTVYVGLSAGSMVLTPRIGEDFVYWKPPTGDDATLGFVDFSIFPHLDHEDLPDNTMANAGRWAAGSAGPAYAIDDETAIQVADGVVEAGVGRTLEAVHP